MNNSTFAIGDFSPQSPFLLAPLAGITDSSFRTLCQKQGAALTYTEMVSAKGMYYKSKNTEKLLYISPEEGPVGIQLFGAEPSMLAYAAKELQERSNVLLDINMGCPVPKVVKNGEGSALLKTPEIAFACVKEVVKHSSKPVTVKIRIGFSEEPFDYTAFALGLEDAGACAITVHGRTRTQFYAGKADYHAIKKIKKAVSIPVIGNGDVFSGDDALYLLQETNCDGIMIARGALGNPWIFRECEALFNGKPVPPKPETDEIIEMIMAHLLSVVEEKGEHSAVREMRKHISWYTKGVKNAAKLRSKINEAATVEQMTDLVYKLGK